MAGANAVRPLYTYVYILSRNPYAHIVTSSDYFWDSVPYLGQCTLFGTMYLIWDIVPYL